jgi:hypothetical protein
MRAARRHAHVAGSHFRCDIGRGVEDDREAVGVHVLHVGSDDERLGARDSAQERHGAGERQGERRA